MAQTGDTNRLTLVRDDDGNYTVHFDGKLTEYVIKRDEWVVDSMDCDHWNCARVHGRFRRLDEFGRVYCDAMNTKRVEWYVWTTKTGDRDQDLYYPYKTRKAAVAAIERRLVLRAELVK